MFDRQGFCIGVLLVFALGGCAREIDEGAEASDQAASPEQQAGAGSAAPPARDIPATEILQTEDEKDLRLINALRAFIPMLMRNYGSPGLNIALARRGEVVWEAGFGYADLAREHLAGGLLDRSSLGSS